MEYRVVVQKRVFAPGEHAVGGSVGSGTKLTRIRNLAYRSRLTVNRTLTADCPWSWSATVHTVGHTRRNILDLTGLNFGILAFFAGTTLRKKQMFAV